MVAAPRRRSACALNQYAAPSSATADSMMGTAQVRSLPLHWLRAARRAGGGCQGKRGGGGGAGARGPHARMGGDRAPRGGADLAGACCVGTATTASAACLAVTISRVCGRPGRRPPAQHRGLPCWPATDAARIMAATRTCSWVPGLGRQARCNTQTRGTTTQDACSTPAQVGGCRVYSFLTAHPTHRWQCSRSRGSASAPNIPKGNVRSPPTVSSPHT